MSETRASRSQVAIIILNWNGWSDTIECLDSIFQSDYQNFQVIVCDNGSTDDSISRILSWAKGEEHFKAPVKSPLIEYTHGLENLPSRVEICPPDQINLSKNGHHKQFTLIPIEENYGFGRGNNIGIRYALSNSEIEYVWLLNNDTVVMPSALSELMWRCGSNSKIGICGSTIYYYDKPKAIQTLGGGTFNKWIASSSYILPNQRNYDLEKIQFWVEERLELIIGASMFVSTKFINEIGLISEDYYLFAEEIDWSIRSEKKFNLGYAPRSVVYHKKGRSTGNSRDPTHRTIRTDYFNIRSRLIFTRNYFPWCLPTLYLSVIPMIFNRVYRGQFERAFLIIRLLVESLSNPRDFYNNSQYEPQNLFK